MLACMTCNACNIQIFARSDSSDEKLRSFIAAGAKPDDVPTPASVPVPVPEKAAPVPVPEKITESKKTGFGWGVMGAING